MTKNELVSILNSIGVKVNEGVTSINSRDVYPRIVFWDYVWSDLVASNNAYASVDTYQISFFAKAPREPKLIELRDALRENNIFTSYYTEYNEEDKVFHTYLSVEVTSNG